jgi:hypothetical protein
MTEKSKRCSRPNLFLTCDDVPHDRLDSNNRASLFKQVIEYMEGLNDQGVQCEGAVTIIRALYEDSCNQWSFLDQIILAAEIQQERSVKLSGGKSVAKSACAFL